VLQDLAEFFRGVFAIVEPKLGLASKLKGGKTGKYTQIARNSFPKQPDGLFCIAALHFDARTNRG
jgi:hypothetical protein